MLQDGSTALIAASYRGHVPIVEALLADGRVNANWNGVSHIAWLYYWCVHSVVLIIYILIRALQRVGQTALMLASWEGHAAVVQALLAVPGVEINIRTR